MSCQDCFNNCPEILSDQCVQYTGPTIPLLGICQGDQLSKFEAQIIQYLLSALDGTGITPKDVTLANCSWLSDQLGTTAPTLNALLQLLINASCTLKDLVTAIQAQLSAGQSGTVWDLSCLSDLPDAPTSDQILQAVINLACSLNTTVTAIPLTYVKNSDLENLITPIVQSIISSSQSSGTPQQNAKMIPYVSYEYYGPLSNFDAQGIGVTNLGYQKVYLCNGSNGTPDKRGRVGVGAIRGVPGGALDAAVDPAVNPNNPNWGLNDKLGETFHTLTVNEIPSHSHQITDPGHKHSYDGVGVDGRGADNAKNATPQTKQTATAKTGITIVATGGGQGHINYQPSIAANYIMYIP
jgi:hypothetical protein